MDNPSTIAVETDAARACAAAGLKVLLAPDLYHLPDDSPIWAELAEITEPLAVLSWLYPRPMKWLLHLHGVMASTTLNLGARQDLATWLDSISPNGGETGEARIIHGIICQRWYPVVDRERCINCGHCMQFCLFGVYERSNDIISVSSPDLCKPGCPACSRICPQGAIMFPLYADPAIAGAPGQYVVVDAAARKMYYRRTGLPCPDCGATGSSPMATGIPCTECGRPTTRKAVLEFDAIDALIDKLDSFDRRTL